MRWNARSSYFYNMQLALGTVQFGLNYGIANQAGQVTSKAMQHILHYAWQHHIQLLDCAHQYGDAEARLGAYCQQHGDQPFQIVSKLTANHAQDLARQFSLSLQRLQQTQVYALLLHKVDDLRQPGHQALWQQMLAFKSQQQVQKIGVSVYHPQDIDFVLDNFDIDVIQLPFNIFDQRVLHSGQLHKLQQKNIEIHVRSIFLQGLLLMPLLQAKLKQPLAQLALDHFHQFCVQQQINPLTACLQFVQQYPAIKQVIVGAQSLTQLEEICTAWQTSHTLANQNLANQTLASQAIKAIDFSGLSQTDLAIIDPSRWF